MKWKFLGPLLIVVGVVGLIICWHPDSMIFTRQQIEGKCDFDLSKTDYRIDTLNSGRLTLVHKEYDIEVQDLNDNFVRGYDTCYLKFRAFKFWENDVKK